MATLKQVQPNIGNSGGAATAALAFGSNTTAQSLQVALVQVFPQSSTLTSVTDSQLNTWVIRPTIAIPGNNYDVYFCYSLKTAGGANTVTAHFSAATTNCGICLAEFSGVDTFRAADAGNTGTATTSVSSAAVTVNAGDLLVAYAGLGGQSAAQIVTPGAGFTNTTVGQVTTPGFIEYLMHNLNATGGSTTATSTLNNSQTFGAGLVGFYQSASTVSTVRISGAVPCYVTNASGHALALTTPTLGAFAQAPTPVCFTDTSGNALTTTGGTAGPYAVAQSPIPVVICDVSGHPFKAPFVFTSNGNNFTVNAAKTGNALGAPTPVNITDPNGFLYSVTGTPQTQIGNPTPICLSDSITGKAITFSGVTGT